MNIVKNIWYMARRFKVATALNLTGLTVAFAAFYLLMTQVDYNQSYNRGLADGDRVFRVESRMNLEAPWGVHCSRPMLKQIGDLPEVEAISILDCWTPVEEIMMGESELPFAVLGTNATPFAAIRPPLCVDGRLDLQRGEHSVLIPASLARTLFSTEAATGRTICFKVDTVTVRGVYADFADNCSMQNVIYRYSDDNQDDWSEWSYDAYVKLHQGVDAEEFTKEFSSKLKRQTMQAMSSQYLAEVHLTEDDMELFERQFEEYFQSVGYRLRPIADTWFSGVSTADRGNPAMLFVLQLACLLIMVVATINFLNFTLAESPMRIKGINTRRVLGESVWSLRLAMVGESVLTALLALALACALVALATHPSGPTGTTSLLLGNVSLGAHPGLVALMVAIAVAVGVAAGVYPAFFATSFAPALALKGSFGLTPRGRYLRTALVCLQLVIALFMVTYIGILAMQSRFIYNSDYGFSKDEVLYARLPEELKPKKDAIRADLLQQSGITGVSFSRFILGSDDSYMSWGRNDQDHTVTFTCMPVDCHYLRTMGISVVEGHDFGEHDGDCYIINQAARRQWPWVEMNQPLLVDELPVVGVCDDVRFTSMRHDRATEPLAFVVFGERFKGWGDQLSVLNVRVGANIDKVEMRRKVERMLSDLYGQGTVEVEFLDQKLEQLYQEEFRFVRQVLIFSAVCLLITLIGVFCLTMFETEYRRKEIGIRKIMGSSTAEVLRLLCRRYVWLLAASFVVASPLAWLVGQRWLQSFAERTPIYWWLFPLALAVVALVTLLTVVAQSWRTANANPIESIKTE